MGRYAMTNLEELRKEGYVFSDWKMQKGYVTRKPRLNSEIDVYIGERGNRKDQYYVLMPCGYSTRFCFRAYLEKKN